MDIKDFEFDGTKLKDHLPKDKKMAHLAREIGITRQALHDISKGRRKPSADVVVRIVRALNIPLNNLATKKIPKTVS